MNEITEPIIVVDAAVATRYAIAVPTENPLAQDYVQLNAGSVLFYHCDAAKFCTMFRPVEGHDVQKVATQMLGMPERSGVKMTEEAREVLKKVAAGGWSTAPAEEAGPAKEAGPTEVEAPAPAPPPEPAPARTNPKYPKRPAPSPAQDAPPTPPALPEGLPEDPETVEITFETATTEAPVPASDSTVAVAASDVELDAMLLGSGVPASEPPFTPGTALEKTSSLERAPVEQTPTRKPRTRKADPSPAPTQEPVILLGDDLGQLLQEAEDLKAEEEALLAELARRNDLARRRIAALRERLGVAE